MKNFKLKLWEPDDLQYEWEVQFVTLKPERGETVFARLDRDNRVIEVNNRLRNIETILFTLFHEAVHIMCGVVGSESFVQGLEHNLLAVYNKLSLKVHNVEG